LRLTLGRRLADARPARALLFRSGPRRLVRATGAARQRGAADPRAGGARPVLLAPLRRDGGRLRRARARPLVVRPVPARAAARAGRMGVAFVPRGRRASERRAPLAEADRGRDTLARPERGRAGTRARAVRRPARDLGSAPLPARAGGARTERRRRRGRALPAARDGARIPPPLGAVRTRRRAARPLADGGAVAVRAFLRRDVP